MSQFTLYRAFIKQRRPSGSTQSWQDVLPLTISWTDGNGNYTILEDPSTHCGYVPPPDPIYRWVNLPISSDYECDSTTYTKYYRQKKQVSHDNGATYNDVSPAEYQRGAAYETNSIDCGYVSPTNCKAVLNYMDGATKYIPCDSSSELTSNEVRSIYTGDIVSTVIGTCVTIIGSYAFQDYRSLSSVTIPNTVTNINYRAFTRCSGISGITIPNSVTSIGDAAFAFCSGLTSIVIPDSVTSLGSEVFEACKSLTAAVLSNNITFLNAFDGCEVLTGITIPNSVTTIGNVCFMGCYGLTSLTIPSGVTSIGFGAFEDCSGLTSVTIEATTPPTLEALSGRYYVFNNTNNCPIYVPAASVNAYKAATGWSDYASRIFPIGS